MWREAEFDSRTGASAGDTEGELLLGLATAAFVLKECLPKCADSVVGSLSSVWC